MPKLIIVDDTTKRRWHKVHKIQLEDRQHFLPKLTIQAGVRIFQDLYRLVQSIKGRKKSLALNSEKIRTLSNIHFAFGKVKIGDKTR